MFVGIEQRGQAGFTLTELLIVIAMIAIIGGIAMPNLSGWICRQNTIKDFTDLASGIAYLQGLAKEKNRSIRLEASGIGGTVLYSYFQSRHVAKKTMCSTSITQWTPLLGEKTELDGTFVPGSPRSACFHGDGSVSQGQSLTWQVGKQCDGKDVFYRVTAYGSTGFIEKTRFNASTRTWVEF